MTIHRTPPSKPSCSKFIRSKAALIAIRLRARLSRANTGTAALEFGLVVPVLLGLLVPLVDLGIALSQDIQVQQAAQAGAQYAASHPWNSNSATRIANAVTSASALPGVAAIPAPTQICGCPTGGAITPATCYSTCANGETAGYYVTVSAQSRYTTPLPYSLLGHSVMLSAQSTVRIR